jgi:hypothetical protein
MDAAHCGGLAICLVTVSFMIGAQRWVSLSCSFSKSSAREAALQPQADHHAAGATAVRLSSFMPTGVLNEQC